MHQGFEDEKGMAPAFDEAPGHTTDSTGVRSPGCVGGGREHVECAGHTSMLQLPDPSSRAV